MLKLELLDRNKQPLKFGDIVKVSDGRNFQFYSEVKYLEKEQAIAPFHTFSFHSFEKVDKLPDHAKLGSEERYKIWFTHSPDEDTAEAVKKAEKYLMDWRKCEHLIDRGYFRVTPM